MPMPIDIIDEIEAAADRYARASSAHGSALAIHSQAPADGAAEPTYYRTAIASRTAWEVLRVLINRLHDHGHSSHALRLLAEAFKRASAAELQGVRDGIMAGHFAAAQAVQPFESSHAA